MIGHLVTFAFSLTAFVALVCWLGTRPRRQEK